MLLRHQPRHPSLESCNGKCLFKNWRLSVITIPYLNLINWLSHLTSDSSDFVHLSVNDITEPIKLVIIIKKLFDKRQQSQSFNVRFRFLQSGFSLHLIHAFFFKHSLNKAFAFSPLKRLVSEIKSLIRKSNTNITTQNKLKIRQKARDGNVCKHRQIFVVSLDLKEQTTISLYLQATVTNSVSEYKTFPGYIAGK